MKFRLATAIILTLVTTLLTLASLGEIFISSALTPAGPTRQLSSDAPETTETFAKLSPRINGYNVSLNSSATITATGVATHYVFLPFVTKPAVSEFVLRVVAETNSERSRAGCPPVTLNQQLTNAAQGHSVDMALNDFVSHTGSDGSTPWERIQATGYQYSRAAENIAAGYPTAEAVMAAWMSSDGHRKNILDCKLEEIGVGYYYRKVDCVYHHYWTQVFATPR